MIDITGKKFGRWLVIERSGSIRGQAAWVCECECGRRKNVASWELRRGASRSCGCLRNDMLSARRLKHGKTRGESIAEYRAWAAMRNRCSNPKEQYRHWRDRGITVCERWEKFENFYEDMGPRPSDKHSLDRIDVDGDYELGNCRWATQSEQQRNRTDAFKLVIRGKLMSIADAAAAHGVKANTAKRRIRFYGWDPELAVTAPAHSQPPKPYKRKKRVRVEAKEDKR